MLPPGAIFQLKIHHNAEPTAEAYSEWVSIVSSFNDTSLTALLRPRSWLSGDRFAEGMRGEEREKKVDGSVPPLLFLHYLTTSCMSSQPSVRLLLSIIGDISKRLFRRIESAPRERQSQADFHSICSLLFHASIRTASNFHANSKIRQSTWKLTCN